jgi:UDP-2,4-diacetamido-2,4,6-trideoxy-beta-L-altropyranose hydrolase
MSTLNAVIFLVNANSSIGFGHLKRCLLIADEFSSRSIRCQFCSYDSDAFAKKAVEKSYPYLLFEEKDDLNQFILESANPSTLLIIDVDDLFFYSQELQELYLSNRVRFMYISVKVDVHYKSHFLLNQNIVALTEKYSVEEYTKTFFGPAYFILDDKLSKIRPNPIRATTTHLLVTFGSADPANVTKKVLDVLGEAKTEFEKIRVVIGGLNKNKEEIMNHPAITQHPALFEIHVDTDNMYGLMRDSDLAITSLGLTYWELCMHNIPSLVISASSREKKQLNFFCQHNYAYCIGDFDDVDWDVKWRERLNSYLESTCESIKTNELRKQINTIGKKRLVDEIIRVY